MRIIVQDSNTGKRFLIKGHGLDWEIFKESKGKEVGGIKKGEGEWTSCRNYPTELPYAIGKAIHWILADPSDNEEFVIEAKTAIKEIRKILSKRMKEITAEVLDD